MTPAAQLRHAIESAKAVYEQETGAVIVGIRVSCHRIELAQGTYTSIREVEVESMAQMGEARG